MLKLPKIIVISKFYQLRAKILTPTGAPVESDRSCRKSYGNFLLCKPNRSIFQTQE